MIKGLASPEEVALDYDVLADLRRMYNSMPSIKIARESFLSMTLCGPFSVSIPKLGLHSNGDMQVLIERYWMPWLRKIYDNMKILGMSPYYFEKHHSHMVPIVPALDLGTISVKTTKNHKVEYVWRWNHGFETNEEKKMFWIVGDHAPSRLGVIQSPLASLLPHYKTILVLQQALEIAATQCAQPTHIVEYHPSQATAKNDDLTQLVATFGEKAAGMSKARQEAARAHEIRIRTAELIKQTQAMQEANALNSGGIQSKQLMWTDIPRDVAERMDSGLATRMFPLRPDFKYVSPQKPSIVADYQQHLQSFDMMASAIMDFSLELIMPTGSARTQNIQGSERFENERIKEGLNFFTTITQEAFVVAYRKQFEKTFEDAKRFRLNNAIHGDPSAIAEMYPELDVQVDMSCTPFLQYAELKEMWMDGLMDKETFAQHSFHMRSLPHEQINVRDWPDRLPKELLVKPTNTAAKPPKKKSKTSSSSKSAPASK
jgi:hypothetical protein